MIDTQCGNHFRTGEPRFKRQVDAENSINSVHVNVNEFANVSPPGRGNVGH